MNKNLLTLTGLLSLVTINQVFGWVLTITPDSTVGTYYPTVEYIDPKQKTNKQGRHLRRDANLPYVVSGPISHDLKDGILYGIVLRDKRALGSRIIASFSPRKDGNGNVINPEKGLVIKKGNGKPVIVENE